MTFEDSWVAIKQAADENKHELILTGASVSKLIEKSGLDKNLFNLHNLNYLSIKQTCLREIPDEIEKLTNLTTLVLHSNEISTLPETISKLNKLKMFDCSTNKLTTLPQNLDFPQLTTINFSSNLLQYIPSQRANVKLTVLDLSNNILEMFPDVCHAELVHLSELYLNRNQITEIPASINRLQALKILNIADNLITVVPSKLAECSKLKEINLKGNKLEDKRLLKLVKQCHSKQVLEYVKTHCPKGDPSNAEPTTSKKGKKVEKLSETRSANVMDDLTHKLKIMKVADDTLVIKVTDNAKKIRPFIAGCIIKNINFTEDSFKKFIQLQTRLHDGICERRNAATLATHDLKLIEPGDMIYSAKPPTELEIQPLRRDKIYTGAALFQQLQTEADNLRKEKKRNVYSGIHKYLYLLEGKPLYPCLMDKSQRVISFPPITNSEITKISLSTQEIFLEVTSAISYTVCRNVLDEFLKDLTISGVTDSSGQENINKYNNLVVQQVKVVDVDGNLKLIYPSRADLKLEEYSVTILRE